MSKQYLISVDQGTTGTKVLVVNQKGEVIGSSYKKHTQYYPQPGWAEHDPEEIWTNMLIAIEEVLKESKIKPSQIAGVGLANQGETCLFWDKTDAKPLYPAIVWSCRRSQGISEKWQHTDGWADKVRQKTGLKIDPYFSGTKFRWMLDYIKEIQDKEKMNLARCGTLDTWLLWKMTNGESFVTDSSTASRTILYNIFKKDWDEEILGYLQLNREMLPKIIPTISRFGTTDPNHFCGIQAPILSSIVDQPAALYGHLCTEPGTSKCTYGTGCFIYINIGNQPKLSDDSNVLASVVWEKDNMLTYSLDGSVYSAGSAIDWGLNELALYDSIDQLQGWSMEWKNTPFQENSVWFIPALSGLATPFWNSNARGAFIGLSHNCGKKDMAKAILEGIAHRVADVFDKLTKETKQDIQVLKVDGKLTDNPYLMQFQADILGIPIEVTDNTETTGIGVAYLCGEALGWWNPDLLADSGLMKTKFYQPALTETERMELRKKWEKVINSIDELYKESPDLI